ncbi:murein biosynthesis integral membrane protein MurJ [Actinocatenispora rupis]|uniref:Lipid II flippase MurJ n=1 Tax=Actinocatenispora rupis TaxID=519421 RepID=A0A8J3NBE2_9ACTN|nr:murein biosynthesis integral membrane protein MurJ [Actinocatenispora rupis]GID13264.1 lipid II flippase MurJ [Actinocatenispora rupis]
MSEPQGRVYRSGDDPRIQHPAPTADDPSRYEPATDDRTAAYSPDGHAEPTAAYGEPTAAYPGVVEPVPPAPTAAGDGLYRSSYAAAREATGLMAPVSTTVADPAATGTLPPQAGEPDIDEGGTDAGGRAGVFRNSAVMAGFNLLSRLLGYGRTVAIGATLGLTIGNAYTTAVYSPQMLYELLMGGTLTSVVVPLLVRARKRDADGGEAFTERFATLAATMLLLVAGLVTLAAPAISWYLTRGLPIHGVVTSLSYVMLPAIFLMGMSALFQAILNTRGSFAAPTWAPILNNLVIIGFFLTFGWIWPDEPTVDSMTTPKILVLGLGFTIAMAVQVVALVPALRKVKFRFRPRFNWRGMGLRHIAKLSAWALCYVAISQIGMTVVIQIAGYASKSHASGTIVYDYGFLLMMTVNGIAAVSVMTALMPRMSAAAADQRYADVAANLSLGTRLSSVLLIPGTALLAVLGPDIAMVLFRYGHFDHAATVSTGLAVAMAGFGLVPFAVSQLQIFTFYALPDTRTPALVNVPVVIVKVAFDLLALQFAPLDWLVPLLLLGNAVSFVVAAVVSYALLRRRIGPLGLRQVASTLVRLTAAAAIAAVPAWLVDRLLSDALGTGRLASLAAIAAGGAVLGIVYFVLAYLFRVREVSEVVGMVRRKLGR